jgi:hypothetical protein
MGFSMSITAFPVLARILVEQSQMLKRPSARWRWRAPRCTT